MLTAHSVWVQRWLKWVAEAGVSAGRPADSPGHLRGRMVLEDVRMEMSHALSSTLQAVKAAAGSCSCSACIICWKCWKQLAKSSVPWDESSWETPPSICPSWLQLQTSKRMQLSPALCGEGNAQYSASLPPPGTFLNRTMVMSCEPCCAHANATKAFVTTKNYKIKPINSQSVTEMKHFNWCMGIGIFFVKIPNIWALTVVSFFILLQQKYLQIWTNTSHSFFLESNCHKVRPSSPAAGCSACVLAEDCYQAAVWNTTSASCNAWDTGIHGAGTRR